MSYRYEKSANGQVALVFDGFEKGIADSPFKGIASMKNVNISYLEGATYVNYKRQRINTAGGSVAITASTAPSRLTTNSALTLNVGDAVTFTTTGGLPAPLATSTTYFVSSVSSNIFQVALTLGGADIVITTTGSGTNTVVLTTMGRPKYSTQSSGVSNTTIRTYILDDNGRVWQDSGIQTTTIFPYFVLLTGNNLNTSGGVGRGIAYWKDYLFVFRGTAIEACGDGTGIGTITSSNWANIDSTGFLVSNVTTTMTTGITQGDVQEQLSSAWGGLTGTYQVVFANQIVIGQFTNGSDIFTFSPAVNTTNASTDVTIRVMPASTEHMALVGIDDVLYFCNGTSVGSLFSPAGQNFTVSDFATMRVNYVALQLPTTDTATWLAELKQNLMVAGTNMIYPWDRISTSFNVPMPINEDIIKMTNILNTLYIFAGSKGDIYTSNGYQISLLKKIPDSFLGLIDPSWAIGGVMFHRYKMWFGAKGRVSSSGATRVSGVFSVTLDNGIINYESQNSYGSSPTLSNSDATGILVDLNSDKVTQTGYTPDQYYSAWQDNNIGGVDYNDTTPWANFEPMVETDLAPIGSALQSRTFENVEYKLDVKLATSDQIRLSFRTNFSEAYTVIGTTNGSTTQVLSEVFNSNIQDAQWVQFKAEFACASTNSSFVRLREIRLF